MTKKQQKTDKKSLKQRQSEVELNTTDQYAKFRKPLFLSALLLVTYRFLPQESLIQVLAGFGGIIVFIYAMYELLKASQRDFWGIIGGTLFIVVTPWLIMFASIGLLALIGGDRYFTFIDRHVEWAVAGFLFILAYSCVLPVLAYMKYLKRR